MADLEKGTQGKETVAQRESAKKSRSKSPLPWGALGIGIAAGLGMGWLSHDFQLNRARKNGAAVMGSGAAGTAPCNAWADSICGRMGELAYECTHARAASALLSDSACEQAQADVLAKLDAIKAARVQCNELTSKLCADLGPEGKGCELARVKEQTFSIKECQDMAKSYPRVLAQIMERQEKGTLPNPPRAPRTMTITKPN